MKKNQQGFSAVEAVVIIVIFCVLALSGWYVWKRTKNTTKSTRSSGQSQQTKPTIPAGNEVYTNTKAGFSIAYPKKWGQLASPTDPSRVAPIATPLVNDPVGSTGASLQGTFNVWFAPIADTQITPEKYAPQISPVKSGNTYIWKVITLGESDSYSTYPVGSVYPIKSYVNPQGITIYDFTSTGDGDAPSGSWVFITPNGYAVVVDMPQIIPAITADPAVSSADMATYNILNKTITDTISLQ